jgi:hypothetical protein
MQPEVTGYEFDILRIHVGGSSVVVTAMKLAASVMGIGGAKMRPRHENENRGVDEPF